MLLLEVFNRVYLRLIIATGNVFTISSNFRLYKIKSYILKLTLMKINPNVFIDHGFDCIHPRNITIGKYCSFGHYNKIWAFNKVTIGDYVQTALGVTIIAGGHRTDDYTPQTENQVFIDGENWIGANVTIIGGVRIGRGAVIGAGSVVTRDVPPYTIAAGVPAKVIKERLASNQVLSPFGFYKPKPDDSQ
jgi:acetyltransferase-like isoleucine patch superfamily enzyme